MYSMSVSSKMTIDHKTGKTKINNLDVKVNGYRNSTILEKTKKALNEDEELPKIDLSEDDEIVYQWSSLYKGLLKTIRNKKYILKNRNKTKNEK